MQWTTAKPIHSGLYLMKQSLSDHKELVKVYGISMYETDVVYEKFGKSRLYDAAEVDAEWIGPITLEGLNCDRINYR